MKKFFLISAITAMFLTACTEKDTTRTLSDNAPQKVTVTITGFTTSYQDMKSGTSFADYTSANVASLTVFNANNEKVYSANQLRTQFADNLDDYGTFSFSLNKGTYKMVVIVSRDTAVPTVTSPTDATLVTAGKETFVYTHDIVVTTSGENNFTATLDRIITKLRIQATDVVPADAKSIAITFTKGSNKHFNPVSGLSADNNGFTYLIDLTNAGGLDSVRLNASFFLPADEQDVAVSYVLKGSNDEILITKNLGQVSFRRNRVTILTGRVFSELENGSFTLNTDWLADYNGTF